MKNIFKKLKDIWDGNFCKHPKETIPQLPPLPEKPKQELQIGCLALGLVKSFEIEPNLWENDNTPYLTTNGDVADFTLKHSLKNYLLQIKVLYDCSCHGGPHIGKIIIDLQGEQFNFNEAESILIYNKLLEYVIFPQERKRKEEKKRKIEKQNAYFVDLGCPKQ